MNVRAFISSLSLVSFMMLFQSAVSAGTVSSNPRSTITTVHDVRMVDVVLPSDKTFVNQNVTKPSYKVKVIKYDKRLIRHTRITHRVREKQGVAYINNPINQTHISRKVSRKVKVDTLKYDKYNTEPVQTISR